MFFYRIRREVQLFGDLGVVHAARGALCDDRLRFGEGEALPAEDVFSPRRLPLRKFADGRRFGGGTAFFDDWRYIFVPFGEGQAEAIGEGQGERLFEARGHREALCEKFRHRRRAACLQQPASVDSLGEGHRRYVSSLCRPLFHRF